MDSFNISQNQKQILTDNLFNITIFLFFALYKKSIDNVTFECQYLLKSLRNIHKFIYIYYINLSMVVYFNSFVYNIITIRKLCNYVE